MVGKLANHLNIPIITPVCRIVRRNHGPPYSQQTAQRFGGRRSGMESMKANSASTCSCSHGSRFALSCNSDSPAASCSICSGVATAAVPAVRVWRAGSTVSWAARARSKASIRAARSFVSMARRWNSITPATAWPSSGDMAPVATAATTAPVAATVSAAVEMGGNDSRMARPLASGQHLFRTRAAAAISPFWAAASTACNTAWAPSAPQPVKLCQNLRACRFSASIPRMASR